MKYKNDISRLCQIYTCVNKIMLNGEKKQDVKYQVYASTSMFKYILMYIDKGQESLE